MTEKKTMVTDLTQGNVATQLLKFAAPLFVSNLLQAIYNVVDMIVVGRVLGSAGTAGVSIGGDMLKFLTFIAIGFSNAGQVVIAQFVGAGQMEKVKKLIGTLFTFLGLASIVVSVLTLGFRSQILGWLNTPDEAWDYAMDYVITCAFGLIFIYGYNIVSAILRGMGDSKRPFMFIAIAAVLNTILDVIFTIWMGMEVFGAALATVIGQAVSFILALIYLYRHKESFGFDFKLSSFKISRDVFSPLLKLGIPMALQSAAIHMSKMFVSRWINAYGVVYTAVSGINNKLSSVCNLSSNAFTTAGASMVGQNIGAEKYDRVPKILRTNFILGSIIAALMSLATVLAPAVVFGIFTTDPQVIETSMIIIPVAVGMFFGAATRSFAMSLINGSGFAKLNLAVALLDGIIARIGFAALLGFGFKMGCMGFWYGDVIAGFMPMVVGGVYFASGKWRTRKYVVKE